MRLGTIVRLQLGSKLLCLRRNHLGKKASPLIAQGVIFTLKSKYHQLLGKRCRSAEIFGLGDFVLFCSFSASLVRSAMKLSGPLAIGV